MMKKVLFVVNILNQSNITTALLPLLGTMDPKDYDVDLYIMLNQGEMIARIPEYVHIQNRHPVPLGTDTKAGQRHLFFEKMKAGFRNGSFVTSVPYLIINMWRMLELNHVETTQLHERMIANGGRRLKEEYDVAIAFAEGAATYYVADYVKAKKKAAFVHEPMDPDGYNDILDSYCYDKMNHVFAVSERVKEAFLEVHPECMFNTDVYYNLVDQDKIRQLAKEGKPEGFEDKGLRLLTVGRLNSQKAFDVAIQAMAYLRKWHYPMKWYVIGEGPMKKDLQNIIDQKKLSDYFFLLGEKENPYPYFLNCDIYVHATRFEGKSIAIQEAQTLGCAVIVSDVAGNRDLVVNGYDGVICDLNGKKLAEAIADMAEDPYIRRRMGNRNMTKDLGYSKKSVEQLFAQIESE